MTEVQPQCTFHLPIGFDDNKLTLLARDPHWLYAYWEVSEDRKMEFIHEFGQERWSNSTPVLKIINISNNTSFYVRINDFSSNWYINVADSNSLYAAELGRKVSDSFFVNLASSNYIATPGESVSTNNSVYFADYRELSDVVPPPASNEIYETYTLHTEPKNIFRFGSQEFFGVNSNESLLGISSAELFKFNLIEHLGISSESLLRRKDVFDDNR